MKQERKFRGFILTFLMLFVAIFSSVGDFSANAAAYDNSNVLKDLRADSSFNVEEFPINKNDYGVYVIQIGESAKGNLYVYTYQPCHPYRALLATDVNMSLSESVDDTKLYELILVNSYDVFAKYLVKDVKVSQEKTRYYNITSIYRDWDNVIDGETGNNNTGEKKAFSVHNIYKATNHNGEITYECEPTYVVTIIDPYSDYLVYSKSMNLNPPSKIPSISFHTSGVDSFDSHYIAFSTDWEIDQLKNATVSYRYCSAKTSGNKFFFWEFGEKTDYGSEQPGYEYPTYYDKVEVPNNSFWNEKRKSRYNWDRIQTVPEFLASEPNLTDETKENLNGKQWILRFLETERTFDRIDILGYASGTVNFTKVSKVAVLRLEFETDGVTYNLGAVSDMVSGDDKGGNVEPKPKSFWDKVAEFFENFWNKVKNVKWWQWLLIGLGIILAIGLIVAFVMFGVQAVFSFIWWLIKKLFKGLLWIVTLPFRLIGKLIKGSKDNSDKGRKRNAKEADDEDE